ncbi:MAG: T9SS type A sorting domain-containing protein [Saprospiraceae bacterium]|nr:T9SS type A sorting domain-containing protein [Saprospiraceae bacterium]
MTGIFQIVEINWRDMVFQLSKISIWLVFSFLCCPTLSLAQSVSLEKEGLVLIEIEMEEADSWVLDSAIGGYTGSGYLQYTGGNQFNNPGLALLRFYVGIEKTGKYRFQWHSRIATGESNTEHNDSWLRFPDAAKYYAVRADQTIYPKGTGMTPNPNGSSSKGWFKVYQNALGKWTWNSSTSDHEPHSIFVEFDTAGIYKLEISGRSNGHAIDRLALYHEMASSEEALSLSTPPSEIDILSSSTQTTGPIQLMVAPNPVYDEIMLDFADMRTQSINLRITNLHGAMVLSRGFSSVRDQLQISLADLPSGTYFLDVFDQVNHHIGKFVKL